MVGTSGRCPLKRGYNYSDNAWSGPQVGVRLRGVITIVIMHGLDQIGVHLRARGVR